MEILRIYAIVVDKRCNENDHAVKISPLLHQIFHYKNT